MSGHNSTRAGFTIVELLIVIVVIAILAAIVVVAYNGIQARANDSRRVQDLKSIVKALEAYKVNTGAYPAANSTVDTGGTINASGWEVSTNGTAATDFLSVLRTSGTVSKIPVDPKNLPVGTNLTPTRASNSFEYFYYRYSAGSEGCVAARGDFYVLGATRMDSVASGATHPASPGFSCTGRDWVTTGAWVTGGYTN